MIFLNFTISFLLNVVEFWISLNDDIFKNQTRHENWKKEQKHEYMEITKRLHDEHLLNQVSSKAIP